MMVLVYWGLTPQQQPGSYQGGEMMMMMKSVFWWRKPEYPEETTDLREHDDAYISLLCTYKMESTIMSATTPDRVTSLTALH